MLYRLSKHLLAASLSLAPLAPLAALSCLALACAPADSQEAEKASHDSVDTIPQGLIAVLEPVAESGVAGQVRFAPVEGGVRVTGRIEGLTPGDHGFHVHEFGDLSDLATGKSAGGHFDADGHDHGKPSERVRHTGDLGNITANADGVARIDVVDAVISLEGKHSILGRSIVVHADADTFVQPTGGAGDRIAVGVIGIAGEPD